MTSESDPLPITLSSLSVVITVRIDCDERRRNLEFLLDYLNRYFDGIEVVVIEHASERSVPTIAQKFPGTVYHHVESPPCFYRARNLNLGVAMASRSLVLLLDVDVFLPPRALATAYEFLITGEVSFVYPYNGIMIQVRRELADRYRCIDSSVLASLPYVDLNEEEALDVDGFELLYGGAKWPCVGGALMAERRSFLRIGGYNTNIMSYGVDDSELDYRIRRISGVPQYLPGFNCYHLEHRRGRESRYNEFAYANRQEYNRVKGLRDEDLRRYVDNGFRFIDFDSTRSLTIVNDKNCFSISLSDPERQPLKQAVFVLGTFAETPQRLEEVHAVLSGIEATFSGHEVVIIERGGLSLRQFYLMPGTVWLSEQKTVGPALLQRVLDNSSNEVLVFLGSMRAPDYQQLRARIDRLDASEAYWYGELSDGVFALLVRRFYAEYFVSGPDLENDDSTVNYWLQRWLSDPDVLSDA